jgi:hypothetical protein
MGKVYDLALIVHENGWMRRKRIARFLAFATCDDGDWFIARHFSALGLLLAASLG